MDRIDELGMDWDVVIKSEDGQRGELWWSVSLSRGEKKHYYLRRTLDAAVNAAYFGEPSDSQK